METIGIILGLYRDNGYYTGLYRGYYEDVVEVDGWRLKVEEPQLMVK